MAGGRKTRLGVIFGGRSGEHEVSIVSAQHVMAAADKERFEIVPIGVAKTGDWLTLQETQAQLDAPAAPFKKTLTLPDRARTLAVLAETLSAIDVAFPLIHGPGGEDGTLQGLLELARIPYAGAGVAASAVGLDKALMKALLRDAGLPVVDWIVVTRSQWEKDSRAIREKIEGRIGYPCFVKPVSGGSSVGITKAHDREELVSGVVEALRFDRKLVIEKGVNCREIECAVLGNDEPQASPLGEVVCSNEFYDYEAKYLVASATKLVAPAELPENVASRIRETAIRAYQALDCCGMSRVDFFLTPSGEFYVAELNTVPGFTPGSMYPRLWQVGGMSYSELISSLVDLGIERFEERERLAQE